MENAQNISRMQYYVCCDSNI